MSQRYQKLINWIKNNNGFLHPNLAYEPKKKLHLVEKMGARGVQLFSISKKLCLDYGDFKDYTIPNDIELDDIQKEICEQTFFKLILNLINEKLKGSSSFFYPLIQSFATMEEILVSNPLFYYNERKEKWKKILPTVITKLDNLNNFYVNLYVLINKLKIFKDKINITKFPRYKTEEEVLRTIVLWSFLIVNTYAIEKSYLMPLFNLMHFCHETNNKLVMDNNKINFSYETIENPQIIINNGLLDNETLFTLHGYINHTNKQYLEIKLSNKYTVENQDVKDKIKEIFETIYDREQQKYYITKEIPSATLVQYLRILSLNNRDLQFIEGDDEFFKKFISMDNEAGVYQKLLKIIQIKYDFIKKYNDVSSKQDDEDEIILKRILKEQKIILKSMFYEVHRKWINLLDTNLDKNILKQVFKLH